MLSKLDIVADAEVGNRAIFLSCRWLRLPRLGLFDYTWSIPREMGGGKLKMQCLCGCDALFCGKVFYGVHCVVAMAGGEGRKVVLVQETIRTKIRLPAVGIPKCEV